MKRIRVAPRPDWREKAVAMGFDWHSAPTEDGAPGTYWDESAYWELTAQEVDDLEAATEELHGLCLAATEHAITNRLLHHFAFPPAFIAAIEDLWARRNDDQPSLYGRFDFSFGAEAGGAPKMLEYNADTPTGLYEAAVVQWSWLEEVDPEADQFNSLHEGLVEAWTKLVPDRAAPIHFSCLPSSAEDEGTLRYLLDTALEAGLSGKVVAVDQIGWSSLSENKFLPDDGGFVDGDDLPITTLFKLIPWEWLLADSFGPQLARALARRELTVIEPAWKMVPANKAILAVLWELFPDHPNLLPAYFNRQAFPAGSTVVAKPLFGREGANVSIATLGEGGKITGTPLTRDGGYGEDPYIYQLCAPLAAADGNFAVIGSWVIDGKSRGIGIREDTGLITHNRSRFVPHLFR